MEVVNKLKMGALSALVFAIISLLLYVTVYNLNSSPFIAVGGLTFVSGLLIYSSYRVLKTP